MHTVKVNITPTLKHYSILYKNPKDQGVKFLVV